MKKRTKFAIFVVTCLFVIGGGLGTYEYAKVKIDNKVATILNHVTDQEKSKLLHTAEQSSLLTVASTQGNTGSNGANGANGATNHITTPTQGASPATSSSVTGNLSSANSNLHFASKQDAIQYAMSKLTPGEIATFMADYQNQSKLTPAQKEQIRQEILSHFSPTELQAIMAALHQ